MDKHNEARNEETFDAFEQDLAKAMKRVDAPEGFADRVLAAAEANAKSAPATLFVMRKAPVWRSSWIGGAIAAMLAIGVFAGEHMHERRERAAMAQQQFDTAMRITDQTLQRTREQLAQQGISLDDQ